MSCTLSLFCTLHQMGRWPWLCHPSLCPHIQTLQAGSLSARCQTWRGEQCWQPALLCLARRREKLHWFAALLQESYGLQPPGRHEHEKYLWNKSHTVWWDWCRTCCEHNFPQLWDFLSNELMLTCDVSDTVAPRQSPHPFILWRTAWPLQPKITPLPIELSQTSAV